MELIVNIAAAAITSAIVTKILATHYFKIMDGYVKDMCNATMESNHKVLLTVRNHKRITDKERNIND